MLQLLQRVAQDFIQRSIYKLTQIDKKIFDNFYRNKNIDDYISDYSELFEGYGSKSKGWVKTELLIDFLIEKEKSNIEYFIKANKNEADNKIQKLDREIITADQQIQYLEEQVSKHEEIQQSLQRRVYIIYSD